MGNKPSVVEASTAQEDERSRSGQQTTDEEGEKRIWASHMYTGPLKLGDPDYRGLSKMEEDPMITQRMRDISRTLCTEYGDKLNECGIKHGLMVWYHCQAERDEVVNCMERWQLEPDFKEKVTEEYLNERSHFRQTGIKTKRYFRGGFVNRNFEEDPPVDKEGKYRPAKPTGWDDSYKDSGPPSWFKNTNS